jgi:hypothetical protein
MFDILNSILLAAMGGCAAFVMFNFAVRLLMPKWQAKRRRMNAYEGLSAHETDILFLKARQPLNSFFSFGLAIVLIFFGCVMIAMALVPLLIDYAPFQTLLMRALKASQPLLILSPALIGLWLMIKAKSIAAANDINQRLNAIAAQDGMEKPAREIILAIPSDRFRIYGFGLILVSASLAYKFFPHPGLPDLPDFEDMVFKLLDWLRAHNEWS